MSFDLSKIEYIDIHSHLQFEGYGEERKNILERMRENKVATICIGADLKESESGKVLAEENENVFYAIGLHPYDNLSEFNLAFDSQREYFQKLKTLSGKKCVAIGECGLDYFYIHKKFKDGEISEGDLQEEINKQKEIFKRHIELALELDLPLMLHVRPSEIDGNKEDAYLEVIEILKEYKNIKGNFHFFVSTRNVLEKILKELPEFTISIPAVCTFTNEYDEVIKNIPLNKIHIETDSPFVLPKKKRGFAKQNEPTFVIEVFEKICEIRNIENKKEFKEILKQNFNRLFLK